MVISVRVSDEQAKKYRQHAEAAGVSISDFVRGAVDSYILEAEEALRQSTLKQERAERIQALLSRTEEMAGLLAETPVASMTDGEVADFLGARYA